MSAQPRSQGGPMRKVLLAVLATAISLPVSLAAMSTASADSISAAQLSSALRGKVCHNQYGTRITFSSGGSYSWYGQRSRKLQKGSYTFGDGSLTVRFDTGKTKTFNMSRSGGRIYLNNDPLRC